MARAELKPIYERLNGTGTYHPFSANTFSDWSLEAGDTITVTREGKSYTSPVHNSTVKWAGQQQISVESTGERKRGSVAKMSASNYNYGNGGGNSYRVGGYRASMIESHIEESENRVRSSVDNLDKKLGTRIEQTENQVSMSVGRLRYSKVEKYASKSKFPATGKGGTLYVAKDTGLSYAWVNPPGIYYVVTPIGGDEANYLKLGEIAMAFNEQTGKTEAKLDADVIYAGKVNGRLVTLQDLELPDWMGATDDGIVALQGNFKTLNAKIANIEKLTAKMITTDNLFTKIANASNVNVNHLSANTIMISSGRDSVNVANGFRSASISQSGNDYTITLTRFNGSTETLNFSRATTLSGEWGSNRLFTVTASPQGDTFYTRLVSSISRDDIVWGSSKYTGTATIHATVNGSSTRVEAGRVTINAYDAYAAGVEDGKDSVTPETHTDRGAFYCTVTGPTGNKTVTLTATWSTGNPPFTHNTYPHIFT